MPWHLSKSDPRKIYDETHDMVCVCRTNDQAAMVVEAVNRYRQPDMIGYPGRKESADQSTERGGQSGENAKAGLPAIEKPDLTALRDAAQGDTTEDAGFAVSRRR